jgi:hypothetical protein
VEQICAPLRAPRDGYENLAGETSDGYASLMFSRGFALDAGPLVAPPTGGPPLLLKRCGSPRRRVLCSDSCRTPAFSGGQAVWVDGVDIHTYRLSDGRRRTYSVPAGAAVGIWPVGNRVLVAADDYDIHEPTGLLTLRLLRLPR